MVRQLQVLFLDLKSNITNLIISTVMNSGIPKLELCLVCLSQLKIHQVIKYFKHLSFFLKKLMEKLQSQKEHN